MNKRALTEHEALIRRAALEEAAKICERAGDAAFGVHEAFEDGCDHCAKAIRALIERQEPSK